MNPSVLLALCALLALPGPAARGAAQAGLRPLLRHGAIRGRIVGPEGAPVPAAPVALVPAPSRMSFSGEAPLDAPAWLSTVPALDLVERASSDVDGRFSFPASPAPTGDGRAEQALAGVTWSLVASAPLLRPRSVECPDGAAVVDLGELHLDRGAGLRGVLLDQDGVPLAGATVTLAVGEQGGWAEARQLRSVIPALAVQSDAAGAFSLPSIPAGALALHFAHREAADLELQVLAPQAGLVRNLAVQHLPRGHRIAGRVLDADGHGLAGACLRVADGSLEVSPLCADPVCTARAELKDSPVFVSGPDGRFELPGVQGPSAHVLVLAPGCEGVLVHCIAAARTDVEIRLERERSLLVQVTGSAAGEPLPEAEVLA
ncbi:MAG TPA: carboxypeptidase-like regulatory domain-containing protein, partial [Planctomycetota bacterium]|nr:carboxypeptidase-like regulatory domain-containing protein [Planctomycetota bacterium]